MPFPRWNDDGLCLLSGVTVMHVSLSDAYA